MKKLILGVGVFVLGATATKAQLGLINDRPSLGFGIGASANYYYGPSDRNFGSFDNDRVNWQLDGMLGITLAKDKAGRRTMIAAFGSYGFSNKYTISQMLEDEHYVTTNLEQNSMNNFYRLEGGLLIADILRISTGVGQQNFDTQTLLSEEGIELSKQHLKYNSSTVGLRLNLSAVSISIDCNFAYGKDFNNTVITPAAGLMFNL